MLRILMGNDGEAKRDRRPQGALFKPAPRQTTFCLADRFDIIYDFSLNGITVEDNTTAWRQNETL